MTNSFRPIFFALLMLIGCSANAQDFKLLKKSYLLVCDDAMSSKSTTDYLFTNNGKWILSEKGKPGKDLKYLGGDLPVAEQHKPQEMMLLPNDSIGSFIAEFDFFQKGRDFSLRDVCVIFGYTNDSTYCFAQAASEMGRYTHNIFRVSNGQVRKIGQSLTPPIIWSYDKWQHITMVRDVASGTVQLWIDDEQILESMDDDGTTGKMGIGTYGSAFKIDNLKVWMAK